MSNHTRYIFEGKEKLIGIFQWLYLLRQNEVKDLFGDWEIELKETPNIKGIATLLSVSESTISQADKSSPDGKPRVINSGLCTMIAMLGGFSLSNEEIAALLSKYEHSQKKYSYHSMFEVLKSWNNKTIEYALWVAFCGTHDQIRSCDTLKSALGYSPQIQTEDKFTFRGISAEEFLKVYSDNLKHLKIQIPAVLYHKNIEEKYVPAAKRLRTKVKFGDEVRTQFLKQAFVDFDIIVPKVGVDDIDRAQRLQLFGAEVEQGKVALTPIEHVLAENSFPRSVVKELVEREQQSDRNLFETVQLSCVAGEGLSLGLAQLAVSLDECENTYVAWIIGDAARTERVFSKFTSEYIASKWNETLFQIFSGTTIAIIIDDISHLDRNDLAGFRLFYRTLKALSAQSDVKISFYLGVRPDFPHFGDSDEVKLQLTEIDEYACFSRMCDGKYAIAQFQNKTLDDVIRDEHRSYRNSVSALIGFLINKGDVIRDLDQSWFKLPTASNDYENEILRTAITAKLLKLPITKGILQVVTDDSETSTSDIKAFNSVTFFEHLEEFKGYQLKTRSNPHSLLSIIGLEEPDKLSEEFCELFLKALDSYDEATTNFRREEALNFARHILQRLAKPHFYKFPQKTKVAKSVFETVSEEIEDSISDFNFNQICKWSGTVSSYALDIDESATKCALAITKTLALKAVKDNKINWLSQPGHAVSVSKALGKILYLDNPENEFYSEFKKTVSQLSYHQIQSLINLQLESTNIDTNYRLNEVILACLKLKANYGFKNRHLANRIISQWFSKIDKKMTHEGYYLDPGSLLLWAEYSTNPFQAKVRAEKAEAIAYLNPRQHGTWLDRAKKRIKAIEKYRNKAKTK